MLRTGTAPSATVPDSVLTHGWVRLARAGVLGGVSLFLATAGHVVGGGELPGAGLLALTGVAVTVVAVSLTARRLRFGRLLAVLAVEQLLLHLLFHAATTAATCAVAAMPGHLMTPATVCADATAASSAGWSMLTGHTLAVAATAWLLARGESWLWRVVDRIHRYATSRPVRIRRSRMTVGALHTARVVRASRVAIGPRAPPVSA